MPFGRPITLTPNIATKTISSSATADQTSFTPSGGYRINEIGVYRNGVRLAQDRDFTAEDGVTVTLLSGCTAGDVVEFIIFDSFNIADAIVGAASSQNINGDVNVTGNLYAGTFHGTATGLTGTPDITIDGLTANDINVSGAATVTGIGTFGSDVYVDGDLNVTGDIVYDEVTGRNLNITGVATAAAIHVGTAQTFDGSGVNITGVVTATTFKGALSGDGSSITALSGTAIASGTVAAARVATLNQNTSGTAGGLSGTPDITVDGITANDINVSGSCTISGTLTYEDVTNVDSVGLVTARTGLRVTAGGIVVTAGVSTFAGTIDAPTFDTNGDGVVVTGIVTASVGCDFNGYKVEEGVYDTTALNGEFDFELEDGHVQSHTGSTAGTYFPDFKVSSGVSLNEVMDVGDVVSCTLIVTASNTAHYCTTGIKIDNSTTNVTIEWIGSAAPTAGKGAGYDIYAFTIQKTAATPAYLVIVNATDAG